MELKGKVAVVTGGGSGIGESISRLFAAKGATVMIFDIEKAKAERVQESILEMGGKAEVYSVDVTNLGDIERAVSSIASGKSIEILVNNAGISHVGNIEGTTTAEFDKLFNVNVKGIYHCMKAIIPGMVNAGGGVILNMASIAGSSAVADRFAYSMTKGAVIAMTYSVAKDYINQHIRCNCLSPARIHTPFVDGFLRKNYPGQEKEMFDRLSKAQPVGRMGKPEEVAQLALYLCSDRSGFITGNDFPIDGGYINLR